MSDTGRMQGRLASSYRQADVRGAERRRRAKTTTDAAPKTAVEDASRFGVGTFLRLMPWRA